jgi:WD40 repeat protein
MSFDGAKKTVGAPTQLVNGHYAPAMKDNNEIWGLASFPNGTRYISVGDDSTLRVWDAGTKKQIKVVSTLVDEKGAVIPLDPATGEAANCTKGRSVDISPDSKYCAVGCRDGTLLIFNVADWKLIKRIPLVAKNKWIQDLKFSPDGKYLAVSAHDCMITVWLTSNWTKKSTCKGSTGATTHIDWSKDSTSLHSNDLSYELLYYNAENGQANQKGATAFRDE